jgi:hypothetical protein
VRVCFQPLIPFAAGLKECAFGVLAVCCSYQLPAAVDCSNQQSPPVPSSPADFFYVPVFVSCFAYPVRQDGCQGS